VRTACVVTSAEATLSHAHVEVGADCRRKG
jgi:hypothetical protein